MRGFSKSLAAAALGIGGFFALIGPGAAQASATRGFVDGSGAPAFCRSVAVRGTGSVAFTAYCRAIEQRLRRHGPFAAALAQARSVRATIYLMALPNGQVAAALFHRSTGNALIDRDLMRALADLRIPGTGARTETFAVPVELNAIEQTPAVVYYLGTAASE